MEKPDFENEEIGGWVDLYAMLHSLHDRNTQPQVVCDAIVQRFEHVWNTHVIPLQEQYRKASEGWGKAIALCDDQIIKTIDLESDNKLLREENTKCKDLAWEAANEISRLNKEIDRLKSEKLGTVPRMFRCSSTGCTWPNCDCSKL